jgi:nucleoside-diphosphate-sugar epimerase
MPSALVTGATGFTGKALTTRLVNDGWDVVAFSRPTSSSQNLAELGADCRGLDITDRDQVIANFPDVDIVFHIAAAYRTEHVDREEFKRVNVDATINLLEASKQSGVRRFVHCSTVGVHGNIDDPPAKEDYRFAPADHYQSSKLEGEIAARKYFSEGLDGVVVRPTAIYGPGDLRFLKLFRLVNKGLFIMIGSGKTLYHMNYIDDLVDGFMLAATHPNAIGQVFTIGGAEYTTLNSLVFQVAAVLGKRPPKIRIPIGPVVAAAKVCEKVCGLIGVSPPIYPRRVEFFQMSRAFSIEKAREMLGYDPQVALSDGLARTADWYSSNNLL